MSQSVSLGSAAQGGGMPKSGLALDNRCIEAAYKSVCWCAARSIKSTQVWTIV